MNLIITIVEEKKESYKEKIIIILKLAKTQVHIIKKLVKTQVKVIKELYKS